MLPNDINVRRRLGVNKKNIFALLSSWLHVLCFAVQQYKTDMSTMKVDAFILHRHIPTTGRNTYVNTPYISSTKSTVITLSFSKLHQHPGESNDAYFKRITAAASDRKLFEKLVLESTSGTFEESRAIPTKELKSERNDNELSSSSTKVTGYVRAEEWEKQMQEKKKDLKNLSWEERVQYEGQRYGNQFNQNEILRKHLKGF